MQIDIDWKQRGKELAIYGVIGAFLTVIRPYNATGNLPVWASFLFWTGLIALGSLIGEATLALLRRYAARLPNLAMLAIVTVTTATVVTLAVYLLERLLFAREVPLGYLPQLFGLVWVISAAMTAIGFMLDRSVFAPPPAADSAEGASPEEAFLSRLPVKYRTAQLYAVSSEDHYLRAHTSHGEELVLMRLADAMRELAGAGGLQVHRSWWVSKAAVRDAVRQGGKLSLVLPGDKQVPVSRTFLADVKAAGLSA